MTNDGYSPKFDVDFQRGKVGENSHEEFLADVLEGLHEVKTDYRAAETGNFYIETRQYNRDYEILSGINITEAKWWVEASPTGDGFIIIRTEALREVMREVDPPETRQPIHNENTNASIGRLVRVDDVLRRLKFKQ